jgi:UDP-N-acetylmuramate: L-alanyl-gamma-D-glutamyl-meso-diaminopimelate ligase
MKLGTMQERLAPSLAAADLVFCYGKGLGWDPARVLAPLGTRASTYDDLDAMVATLASTLRPGDHVLVMSNGGFGGVHEKLLAQLRRRPMRASA